MVREPRSEFIGRRRELDALAALLRESRLVTLTGVGGVGKTRLAMRAVNTALQPGIPVWSVALDAVQDPRNVAMAVARALPFGDLSSRDPLDFIVDVLGGSHCVIVLDNCEHLIDAVAAFVDELLDALPVLTVVATSRRRLELDGEQVFPVPPLDVDSADDGPAEAVELLVARARAGDAAFHLAPAEVDAAASLCRALDGLPLAIELAAARLRTLTIADLSRRLSSRFTLLSGGPRTAVARQRTLHAVVDWSYELCSPAARALWAALSVFSGSFDLSGAIAVSDEDEAATVDALDELIAQSLVESDRETGRFRLLETIRGYGRERAEEAARWPQLMRRHLDHFRGLASLARAHWYGPAQRRILAGQRADRAELHAALRTAMTVDTDTALAMFSDLRYHWGVGGFLPEGRNWAARVLALPGSSPAARVHALVTAAWLCLLQGALTEAAAHLDEAEPLISALPPATAAIVQIELHRWRGTRALFADEGRLARQEFSRSIEIAIAADHPEEALLAQFQLTTAASHLGLPDASLPALDGLAYATSIGERWMRSLALWSLALAAFTEGSLEEAESRAREALTLEEGIEDPVGDCLVLELLSWIDAARSPTERSAVLLGAAQSRWRRIGSDIRVHGPRMGAHHERCVAVVRQKLGAVAFDRLTAVGERLSLADAAAFAAAPGKPATGLSGRETEVAAGIHEGLSNREIAERLVLSVRTVDTHVQRILAKLGFTSRAQIAVWYEALASAHAMG